jgi:hypothetical protein
MISLMKTNKILHCFGLILGLAVASSRVALAEVSQSFDVGAKQHRDHSKFEALPYGDGDLAYSVAYEYRDNDALWQLACDLTPDLTGSDAPGASAEGSYAVSPQLNLLLLDRMFQGGAGVLSTYTHSDIGGDWMDLYWQLILGIRLPLPGAISVQANAYYVFERWGDAADFDANNIEFGAYVGYKF